MQPDPVTVTAETSLLDVQHLLVAAAISGVPVVARGGTVIGVISASDVLQAIELALDEDLDEGEASDPLERLDHMCASDIATREVIWVSPDTPVEEVARVMQEERIHRVLVGEHEHLQGVITAFDLLRAVGTGT